MAVQFNSTTLIVDDNSTLISYSASPPWQLGGQSIEYDGTTHGLVGPNTLNATATFRFTGSAIEVYGTVGPIDGGGPAVYQIDGMPPVLSTNPLQTDTVPSLLFYRSPPLDPTTPHILIITPAGDNTTRYWLDYLLYTPPLPNATATSSSSSSSVLPTASEPSSPDATNSVKHHDVPVGAIVGGAVGGAVALAIILALIYIMKLQRKLQRYHWSKDKIEEMLTPELPPPSHYPEMQHSTSYVNVPLMSSVDDSVHPGHGSNISSLSSTGTTRPHLLSATSAESPAPVSNARPSKALRAQRASPVPPEDVQYHRDGGIRLEYQPPENRDPDEVPVDVPPVYGRY
ncbi:hypothetical protein BV25DRAFT_1823208 [Artomyces pyxidatus]|uniref:Uncharacterized protein n=1 Tax=Artomyces pyxidatus TaxID=48021 RepID=A0ACB8T7V8_9AGAM|nr:hypothetical protein BV25DRAFT_1823208 [Artomyces pyxidatus]